MVGTYVLQPAVFLAGAFFFQHARFLEKCILVCLYSEQVYAYREDSRLLSWDKQAVKLAMKNQKIKFGL